MRWKGRCPPYRVFRKDQRVSHTAIVQNKRLRHALKIVKAQQNLNLATKVMTNSEKTLYKKRPKSVFGLDFDKKSTGSAAVKMMEITLSSGPPALLFFAVLPASPLRHNQITSGSVSAFVSRYRFRFQLGRPNGIPAVRNAARRSRARCIFVLSARSISLRISGSLNGE